MFLEQCQGLVAEVINIAGCKVWFGADPLDIGLDVRAGICCSSSVFEGEFALQQSKVAVWAAHMPFHRHG